jgi:hypothetical protein
MITDMVEPAPGLDLKTTNQICILGLVFHIYKMRTQLSHIMMTWVTGFGKEEAK